MIKRIFYGWAVLALCILVKTIKATGQNNIIGFIIPSVIEDLNISRTTLSTVFSVATIAASASNPFSGRLIDRYGARRCIPVALLLFAASLGLFGFASTTWQLFIAFLGVRGCAIGALELWPNTCVNQWFIALRGRAMAIFQVASSGGFALLALVYAHVYHAEGWRFTQYACAVGSAALALPAAAFLFSKPEHLGLLPDGAARDAVEASSPLHTGHPEDAPTDHDDHGVHLPEQVTAELLQQEKAVAHNPKNNTTETVSDFTFAEASRWPVLWIFCFVWFTSAVMMAAVDFYIVEIIAEAGGDFPIAVYVSIPFSITSAIVSAFTGVAIDRKWVSNRIPLAIGACSSSSVMSFLVLHANTPFVGVIYGIARGIGSGAWATAYPVFLASSFGRSHLGSIIGVAVAFCQAGTGVGPLVFGIGRDLLGSYKPLLYTLATIPIPLCAAMLLLKPPTKCADLATVEMQQLRSVPSMEDTAAAEEVAPELENTEARLTSPLTEAKSPSGEHTVEVVN
eukprot:TRINITY_DN11358_c0_g1_i1.p1 TRINITY_DN11358_c0_g1~~TRINITY_DN11358_c0_g1_i1.p1  ORF type:complete len:538 (-),score=79.26 TRINITY_DN11358_c0_g1_i1:26-1558(-)